MSGPESEFDAEPDGSSSKPKNVLLKAKENELVQPVKVNFVAPPRNPLVLWGSSRSQQSQTTNEGVTSKKREKDIRPEQQRVSPPVPPPATFGFSARSNLSNKGSDKTSFRPDKRGSNNDFDDLDVLARKEDEKKTAIENFNLESQGSKESKRMKKAVFAVVVVVLVVAVALIAGLVTTLSKSSSDTFTCGSAEKDAEIRAILSVKLVLIENLTASVENVVLGCLPADAFALLSVDKKAALSQSLTLLFTGNGISKLSSFAFKTELVGKIESLRISGNGLTSLAPVVFEAFPNLRELDLSGNALVNLEARLFENIFFLETLFLNDITGMTSFPEALRGLTQLTTLQIRNAISLVQVAEGLLKGIPLVSLDLTGSRITSILTETQFRSISGVIEATTIIGF